MHQQQLERAAAAAIHQQSGASLGHATPPSSLQSIRSRAEHNARLRTRFRQSRNFLLHHRFLQHRARNVAQRTGITCLEEAPMHGIIYLVGLIVVILFILSLLGLR
jgi:hypothetical protein